MPRFGKNKNRLSVCAIACLLLPACTVSPVAVRQGDRVALSFDCRLPGGELAATTRPDALLAGEPKASVYLPRTGPETVTVTAGPQASAPEAKERLSFEQEILQRMAPMVVGLHEGGRSQWVLEAERFPVSTPNERSVRLATVRKRPKELRLTGKEYSEKTGKSPAVGEPFVTDRMVPGRVSEVTTDEVVIRFAPAGGAALATPFGPVSVREEADHYELEIAAEKGRLIRTGGFVGRIADADRDLITVDYGHPFGGEKLDCAVTVVQVERGGAGKVPTAAEKPAPAAADPRDAAKLDTDGYREAAGLRAALQEVR